MARIQILEFPAEEVGGIRATPFAIIIDQYDEPIDLETADAFREFRKECGARYLLVVPHTLSVAGSERGQVPVVPYVPRPGYQDPLTAAVARIAEGGDPA